MNKNKNNTKTKKINKNKNSSPKSNNGNIDNNNIINGDIKITTPTTKTRSAIKLPVGTQVSSATIATAASIEKKAKTPIIIRERLELNNVSATSSAISNNNYSNNNNLNMNHLNSPLSKL